MKVLQQKTYNSSERLRLLDNLRLVYGHLLESIPDSFRAAMPVLPLKRLLNKNENSKQKWFENEMLKVGDNDWRFILLNLYSDVLHSGHIVIEYCDYQVYVLKHYYDKFEFLYSQNTMALQPGQTLEIKAGVGAFNVASKPTFFIEGKEITANELGYVLYKKKISNNDPGMLSLVIKYTDQNGQKQQRETTINYKVLPP